MSKVVSARQAVSWFTCAVLVFQMTRTSLVCHHWSSVCLLTTLLRARCGSTVSGSMVGEPRKTTGDPRQAGSSLHIQGPYIAERYLTSPQ